MRMRPSPTTLVAFTVLSGLTACRCGEDFGIGDVPGAVEARLCNPVTGAPEAGHKLVVSSSDGAQEARSDADGWARLPSVPSGDVTVRITHAVPGGGERQDYDATHRLAEEQVLVLYDNACVDFPLAPGRGGIQGQVCNRHTGTLQANAVVRVRLETGETQETRTDQGGFFKLSEVPAGSHALTVSGEGFQRTWPVLVEAGHITQLQLGGNCRPWEGGGGNVEGQLCVENGAGPWSLAHVTLILADGTVLEDTTDIDGRFLLEGVPAGEHVVVANGGGESASYPVTVVAGQTTSVMPGGTCPLPGPDTGDVRGQLCDPEAGGWLVGATAETTQGGRTFRDHTDERGRFHLAGLTPGDVVITVTKGTYSRTFNVPIVAGSTVTVADGVCAPPTWECKDRQLAVEDAAPLRIMLLVDRSGSMDDDGLDGRKWDSATTALKQVTMQLDNTAEFGLALFPDGDVLTSSCDSGRVVVTPARGRSGSIENALDATGPGGGTPTGASVQVVHQWLLQNPTDNTTLVIVATDGVPNCNAFLNPSTCYCPIQPCPGSSITCCQVDPRNCCLENPAQCLDDSDTVAAVAAMYRSDIRTYVIGLPGSDDPTDVLSRMAQAGGTSAGAGQAYYQPTSTEELVDDMTAIVQSNRSCRFVLGESPNDPQLVEVKLDGVTVPRDPARRSGWDLVGEDGIELFGTPCRTLRSGSTHALDVHYCTDA